MQQCGRKGLQELCRCRSRPALRTRCRRVFAANARSTRFCLATQTGSLLFGPQSAELPMAAVHEKSQSGTLRSCLSWNAWWPWYFLGMMIPRSAFYPGQDMLSAFREPCLKCAGAGVQTCEADPHNQVMVNTLTTEGLGAVSYQFLLTPTVFHFRQLGKCKKGEASCRPY